MRDTNAGLETSPKSNEATSPIRDLASNREAIAVLAYFYWEERGCPNDSPHEDWFRAEAQLRDKNATTATA